MKFISKFLAVAALVLVPAALFAQDAPAAPDYLGFGVSLIAFVGGFLTTVAVFFAGKLVPQIPAFIKPFLVLGLGQAAAYVAALSTSGHFDPIVGALVALAAKLIYAVFSALQDHGFGASK